MELFGLDPNDFLPRLVTMDETWLFTMTRRQSNNQWSGGIAARPAPKIFRVQKSAGKLLASIFWNQDGILLIDYLPKGQTVSSVLVQLKDILKVKLSGKVTKHDKAPAHGALATQKKLLYLATNVLITHPILRIWSRRTTTCSLD